MASNVDKVKDSVKGLDFPFDIIVVSEIHHTPWMVIVVFNAQD